MRKKIARRLRRECLGRGVEIVRERFNVYGLRRKDCAATVVVKYMGFTLASIGRDYLEAYRMIVDDLDWVVETARREADGNSNED